MFRKMLPITIPPVVTYSHHAHQLAITMNKPESELWLLSNYVQLYSYQDDYGFKIDYLLYDGKYPRFPGINTNWLNREFFLKTHGDIIKFLVDCINEGFYPEIVMDEFYIPCKKWYLKKSKPHQDLIYGYDLNEQIFYGVGFNRDLTFARFRVAFKHLEEGFLQSPWAGVAFFDCTTRLDYTNTKLSFDLQLVKQYTEDFLHEKNSFAYWESEGLVFGVGNYRLYSKLLLDNSFEHSDIRPLHIFREHIQLMIRRVDLMRSLEYAVPEQLKVELGEIYAVFSNMCFLLIKYNMKPNPSKLQQISNQLEGIIDHIEYIMSLFLKCIKDNCDSSHEK